MTYAALQTQIFALLNRPEVEQQIPSFISLAEAEMQRALRVRPMVGRAVATLDNEYEVLPPDFAGVRTFELASSPSVALEYVSPERLSNYRDVYASAGTPIYYSVLGGEFRFVPRPSTTFPGSQLTYWRKIPVLSGVNTTNWLLETYPDVYLYGALKHAAMMTGDARLGTPQAPGWSAAFTAALAAANAADGPEDREKP